MLDSLRNMEKKVKFSAYADDLVYLEDNEVNKSDKTIEKAITGLVKVGNRVGLRFSKEKCFHLH